MLEVGKVEEFIYHKTKKKTIIAALLDPENFTPRQASDTAKGAIRAGVSLILIGGSTISNQGKLDSVVRAVKKSVASHVILFPGNITGVSHHADAIFFSSLLNSTNSYFIVGAQAIGGMEVYRSGIESIPMGYLIFGNGSAAGFIGQINPLPLSKPSLAVIYALAAKYMGMRFLYLEAGSGSTEPIQSETISSVRKYYDGILLVGGGITSPESTLRASKAGADVIVIGNLLQSPGWERRLRQLVVSLTK